MKSKLNKKNQTQPKIQKELFPVYKSKKKKTLQVKTPIQLQKKQILPTFILSIKKSKKNKLCIEHTPTGTIMFEDINPIALKMILLNLNSLNIYWTNKAKPIPKNFIISCINTLRFAYKFYNIENEKKSKTKKKIKRRKKK